MARDNLGIRFLQTRKVVDLRDWATDAAKEEIAGIKCRGGGAAPFSGFVWGFCRVLEGYGTRAWLV